MPPAVAVKDEYTAHVDSKKRVVVRAPTRSVYRVREYADGHLVLIPCDLVPSPSLRKETLAQIERSIANLKAGKVSGPIDVKAAIKLFQD